VGVVWVVRRHSRAGRNRIGWTALLLLLEVGLVLHSLLRRDAVLGRHAALGHAWTWHLGLCVVFWRLDWRVAVDTVFVSGWRFRSIQAGLLTGR